MQKVQYDHQPPKLEKVGNGSYLYRWEIEKKTITDEKGNTTEIWECYEVITWKKNRKAVTEAAINLLKGSANEEAKLINDFNAANAGLLDVSLKQPYLDYIQKRDDLKTEIKTFFENE